MNESVLKEEIKADLEEIMKSPKNRPPKIPRHFRDYLFAEGPRIAESAVDALALSDRVHYVMQEQKIDSVGDKDADVAAKVAKEPTPIRVYPVDRENTGEIEMNTQWDGGLQQAVQLDNCLKQTSLSVAAAYTDYINFNMVYGSRMSGHTGTLGSNAERNFTERLYNAITVIIPRHRESLFRREKSTVIRCREKWLDKMCEVVSYLVLPTPILPKIIDNCIIYTIIKCK